MPPAKKDESSFLISPTWAVKDGHFHPLDWEAIPQRMESAQLISILCKSTVKHASLFLRGSMLEQKSPHPQADVDIFVVTSTPKIVQLDLRELKNIDRPLDIRTVDLSAQTVDPVFLLLIHCRSLFITGEAFHQCPIPINKQLWVAHWLRYAPFSLPRILHSEGLRRLSEIKQIIRSIGVIQALKHNQFSRDLHTCIEWAKVENPAVATLCLELLQTVYPPYPPFDISMIQHWLRREFYAQIKHWDSQQ